MNDSETIKEPWKKALLLETATVGEAISNLNNSQLQIILIISANGSFVGTVTDGDIRRGLLNGLDLASPIDQVIQRNPLIVSPEIDRESAVRIMQAKDIQQIPVVNDEHIVVGLHTTRVVNAPVLKSNTMVIMAGGQGKRLHPYTENCPKPMLKVAGKPILEHIIEKSLAENFHHFVISINYLGHLIESYFGDGSRWGASINYVRENEPLGTAGSLSLMHPRPDLPILVTNGDVLSDISFSELLNFHHRHNAIATMAIRIHEWQHPFGVVNIDGVDIVGFEEKPISRHYINAGVYVLMPEALKLLVAGAYCDMPTLFALLQGAGSRTIGYPMHEPWIDVGRIDDLKLAQVKHSSNTNQRA